ncbi:MAG: SlyX family protein [Methyloversatilis sp.]|nr:SlyX family protein [Methyloversatilis sp.]MBP6193721.1 SlyX family protein [Methyloversatilis sp.]MBP9117729.1 SlyX family protein [Methyloversatilis sp.]
MTDPRNTERLDDLEARITLMDDMLDALNRTVFEQQRQIESLQQQLRHVYQQMQSQSQSADAQLDVTPDPRQDIPPHY